MKLFPSTRIGKLSAWLLLGAVVIFLLLILFGEWLNLLPDVLISILGTLAILALLVSGVLAVLCLFKREKAILLYLAVAAALVEILFIAINILSELG